jgi:tubulin beta
MGTKFWEVVCDEHGIGGSGEYCGENDSHLDCISALYHEALGGKCGAEDLVNHMRG